MKTTVIRNNKVFSLKADGGKVSYLMKAGSDMVRHVMSRGAAVTMMTEGKLSQSAEIADHPICVNYQFFFPGTVQEIQEACPEPERKPKNRG